VIVTVGTHKLLGGDFVNSKQTRKKQDVWLMEGRYVKRAGVGAHWGEPSVKPNCDGVEAPRQDTGSPGVGYAKLQQCCAQRVASVGSGSVLVRSRRPRGSWERRESRGEFVQSQLEGGEGLGAWVRQRAEEQSCAGERRKNDDVGSLVEDGGGGWGFRKRGSCFPRLMQVQDFQVSAARSKDRTRPGRDQAGQDTGPHKRESGPNQTRGERE
jgi:hypothetical protein